MRAPLLLLAALVPSMVEHGRGSIINSVAPGVVDTALWAANKKVPGVPQAIDALTPLRRWARPEDVADVIVFLASDAARFVTGETVCADGGMAHALDLYRPPADFAHGYWIFRPKRSLGLRRLRSAGQLPEDAVEPS
ncbi:MAG TPA: SDR family oxidoreductase [Acidimicrobiales bacterium]|nr:SDR family oxidoreductase [Acidimicrobiales bacterium]